MKLFTIAAAVLLRCIRSGEAAAPRLRINNYAEEVAKSESASASTSSSEDNVAESKSVISSQSRERISQYVRGGQMFFIVDNQTIVYEDPSKSPVTFDNIYWFCQPTTAPDLNGDGQYDSVVSHVNIYVPAASNQAASSAGATGADKKSGGFTTHGYTASWVEEGGYYNEHVVDFGDTTVWQIHGKEFIGYETSPSGTTGGMVSSGEGAWTFDTSDPLLQQLATAMDTELTPEACAERYAQTWNEAHSSEGWK